MRRQLIGGTDEPGGAGKRRSACAQGLTTCRHVIQTTSKYKAPCWVQIPTLFKRLTRFAYLFCAAMELHNKEVNYDLFEHWKSCPFHR